jgi:hypothetical protein
MPRQALQKHLADLHDELASAGDLDPALRQQLRDVADDIESLLGEPSPEPEAAAGSQLRERLRLVTVEFEAEHPRLARMIGDVADTLTKLGI